MKKILLTLVVFPGLLILGGCEPVSFVKEPATLYAHLSAEPPHLNPITATDAYASLINESIYESLLTRHWDSLEMEGELAHSWTISPDRLRYRFHVTPGILWSDGVEFTSDDIVYSYRVIMDPKTANAHLKVYYSDIVTVQKIDRYTVEFVYRKPYFLALEICGSMPIVPRHLFDNGTDINNHAMNRRPVGTGPYKLKNWETGKRIELVANENYRGKKPAINRIVYRLVMEQSVAFQMLKKGELDSLGLRPIQWVRQTGSEKFQAKFYRLRYWLPNYSYIGWNAARPLFADKRVRRAMTHLVNREAILDKLLFGQGQTVTGTFYLFSRDYNKSIPLIPYDPVAARKLLAEAGWRDTDNDGILDRDGKKFSFTFTMASSSKFAERLATILKEDLRKVGIEMEIVRYEWAVFIQKIQAHDFDAVTLGWSLGYSGDPYQLWHSSQIKGGSNHCSFNNSEADTIMERAREEFDDTKRRAMYHRFHEILHEEQPYTFLFVTPALSVVSRRFDNVTVHVRGLNEREWRPVIQP